MLLSLVRRRLAVSAGEGLGKRRECVAAEEAVGITADRGGLRPDWKRMLLSFTTIAVTTVFPTAVLRFFVSGVVGSSRIPAPRSSHAPVTGVYFLFQGTAPVARVHSWV